MEHSDLPSGQRDPTAQSRAWHPYLLDFPLRIRKRDCLHTPAPPVSNNYIKAAHGGSSGHPRCLHIAGTRSEDAEHFNMSRPFLVDLLEAGTVPFHKVSTHTGASASTICAPTRTPPAARRSTSSPPKPENSTWAIDPCQSPSVSVRHSPPRSPFQMRSHLPRCHQPDTSLNRLAPSGERVGVYPASSPRGRPHIGGHAPTIATIDH